jgi:hypothetical protein
VRYDELSKRLDSSDADCQALRTKLAETTTLMNAATVRAGEMQKDLDTLRSSAVEAEASRQAEQANRKGELTGSVSYFFNDNYGYKPDVGSEAFVWRKGVYPESLPLNLAKYHLLKSTLTLKSIGGELNQWQKKMLVESGIGSAQDLETMGGTLFDQLRVVIDDMRTIKLSIDGSGGFRHSLPPGDYYLLVRSSHRSSTSLLEVSGDWDVQAFTIAPGEEAGVTVKFGVD